MRYITTGFQLINTLDADGLIWAPAAIVDIVKGQALHDDTAGYATNATTALAATFLGIAAATVSNSGGSAGDLDVPIIPPRPHYRFRVANASVTVAAQTDVGEIIDLEAAGTVDVTDVTIVNWGFLVEQVDISTAAVAANTGGFCIGRFQLKGAS